MKPRQVPFFLYWRVENVQFWINSIGILVDWAVFWTFLDFTKLWTRWNFESIFLKIAHHTKGSFWRNKRKSEFSELSWHSPYLQAMAIFAIARFKPFSCPFPLLFLASFTLATFCISYPFWLLQKVGYWLRTKPGNGILISYGSNGAFYDHFRTKTDNVDSQVATSQCNQNPKTSVVQIDLS